jgi:hypothetical protein
MADRAPPPAYAAGESLVTVLDRVLDTGIVVDGQIVLTVAGVDLVFIGLRALVASIDTARHMAMAGPAPPRPAPARPSPPWPTPGGAA